MTVRLKAVPLMTVPLMTVPLMTVRVHVPLKRPRRPVMRNLVRTPGR